MEAFTLVAALALAGVFAVAGFAKLRDLAGTRTAVRAFGTPEPLVGQLALVVPAAELAVAALLLVGPTRALGAAGALVLLGIFSAATAVNLARGRNPECNCFGNLHSTTTSWRTLVRNGLLAIAGGVVLAAALAGRAPSAIGWVGRLEGNDAVVLAFGAVLAVVVAVGGMTVVSLLRSNGRILLRIDRLERALADAHAFGETTERLVGIPVGAPVPALSLTSLDGEPVSLSDPVRDTLVVFWNPECGFCRSLHARLRAWERSADRLAPRLVIVSSGEAEATAADGFGSAVVLDPEFIVGNAFGADGTPMALLLDTSGRVATPLAGGAEAVLELAALRSDLEHTTEGIAI